LKCFEELLVKTSTPTIIWFVSIELNNLNTTQELIQKGTQIYIINNEFFWKHVLPKVLPLTPHWRTHLSQKAHEISSSERRKGGTIFSTLENNFGDFGFLFSPGRSLPTPVPIFPFWKVWWPCLPASCTHIFILEGVVSLFTHHLYPYFHFERFNILPSNTHVSFPPWLMVSIICFLSFPRLIVPFKVLGASLSLSN
jgi:hypothetical protein